MNKTVILILSVLITIFLSCKKKQVPESEPVIPQEEKCLIKSISGNVGYGQSFTYDEQGRVILTTGKYFDTYSYSYSKDQIITKTGSGAIQTYTLDQEGRIITVVDSRSKRDYIYNANGYLINMNYYNVSTGSQPVLNPSLSASYTYTDGNLTLIEQDSGNTKLTVEYNDLVAKDPFITQMGNLPFPSKTIAPMLARYLGKQSKNLFDSSKNYVIDQKGNVERADQLRARIDSGPANFYYNCK